MEKNYIKKVELEGIHKRYDLTIDFNSTLNILYGQNGTGKSTLMHIITNVANCDFIRFAFIDFKNIKVTYSNNAFISVNQKDERNDKTITVTTQKGFCLKFTKREVLETIRELDDDRYGLLEPELTMRVAEFVKSNRVEDIKTSYFPAFRTMLEAWSTSKDYQRVHPSRKVQNVTMFARNLFGQFLPTINYLSPLEIEQNLREEIRDCQMQIARYESSLFSVSFVKVFSSLLSGRSSETSTEKLLKEISQLTTESTISKLGDIEENSNIYRQLQALVTSSSTSVELQTSASGALSVYRDALKERKHFQQKAFQTVDTYLEVVNSFLDKKELSYELDKNKRMPKVGLKFPDETWSSIKVMSSGERQLLTMLYAVNRMSDFTTVLIDEPEISLHIDWQEDLLEKMMEQLGDRQIIVCTHSPSIAADFDEYMKEITPVFNDISSENDDSFCDSEESY